MLDLKKELIAVENLIKEMDISEGKLLLTQRTRRLSSKELIQLEYIQLFLALREMNRQLLLSLLPKVYPPEDCSRSFEDADYEWTESVTGISCTYRKWIMSGSEIDQTIVPTPRSKENYLNVVNFFDLDSHASRVVLINVYLRDILFRPELENNLRVFPGIEVSVASSCGKRRLHGRTDPAIGSSVWDQNPASQLRFIVVEAKNNDLDWQDLCYCTAQAAALYRTYKDSGSSNCCVWGVISNASHWKFIFIDESGNLWRSNEFIVEISRFYDELHIKMVYRILYYVITCCNEIFQRKALAERT